MHCLLAAVVVLLAMSSLHLVYGAEELAPAVAEVAPGVYRVRAGEPEEIVPSMVRQVAATKALAAMPRTAQPALLPTIKFWQLARGVRIELPLRKSEVVYGLGLQCKHLEQNGWRRTLFAGSGDNDGKGVGHAPVPFYVSTAGYGVLVDSARYLMFSVGEKQRLQNLSGLERDGGRKEPVTDIAALYGAEKREATSVYVDVPAARGVDIYVFAGPDLGQAVSRYNLFSGGGCLPSLAALAPGYLCGAMLDAKAVCAMGEQLKRDGLCVTSLGLEPNWQTHAYSSSYMWNTEKFPADTIATIIGQGYDLNLWCQAYIDPSSPLLPLLNGRYGDFEVWRGVVPDLADAQVRKTYADFLRENFIRKGIAGFKLDEVDGSCNSAKAYEEWQFPEFSAFPSGADGEQMRNLLGRLGAQAVADAFRQQNRRTFGLVRASQAWAAPVPMAIYSDEYNFPDYVRYNLSAGVQGLIWTPEVRHADNERDWALRVGAAAFSARMLYNAWQFPHFPWQQPNLSANERHQLLPDDNPYLLIARHFNKLRMVLLPYLYQAYSDYRVKGVAPVRPLVADWPDDANTRHIDDEWMLGTDLLVAPLTDENAFSEVYRVAPAAENRFRADPGVQMKIQEDLLLLDIAGTQDGLPGASAEFDLKAGPCVARFMARGDIGRMAMRLRRVEKDRENDVGELYKDDIQLDVGDWAESIYRFQVPADGHYRLSVGKGYFLRLQTPKRLELRGVSFEQKTGNPRESWKRMVYLPAGGWRDFWTGGPLAGGRWHTATATPQHPLVFVRENTLLPLAEPVVTMDSNTVFNVHLAAYGDSPRPCPLREDDGTTFDFEKGKWATLSVKPDGTFERPDHGQPQRYHVAGKAEQPEHLLRELLGAAALRG